MTDDTGVQESSPTLPTEPEWYLDDNTPGSGARPDWMPSNYKKVSDIAKSYTELEKKLGAFKGAPEKYDVASMELDENDFVLQELSSVGKELNMSQEAFQKVVGRLLSAQETHDKAYLEDQVAALGPDGARMLTEYKNWTKDYLTPEAQEVVGSWVKTADDLKIFNKIMASTTMSNVPSLNSVHMANNFETVADLRKELMENVDKFEKDKNYRENWISRNARAVARNPER